VGRAILSQFNGLTSSQMASEDLSYKSRIKIAKQRHVQSISTAVRLLPLHAFKAWTKTALTLKVVLRSLSPSKESIEKKN